MPWKLKSTVVCLSVASNFIIMRNFGETLYIHAHIYIEM